MFDVTLKANQSMIDAIRRGIDENKAGKSPRDLPEMTDHDIKQTLSDIPAPLKLEIL